MAKKCKFCAVSFTDLTSNKNRSHCGSKVCKKEQSKHYRKSRNQNTYKLAQEKFQKDMTWNNYGDWHIDHIKPLVKYNLKDIKQLKEACNYMNLQPLWAKDNLSKGAK